VQLNFIAFSLKVKISLENRAVILSKVDLGEEYYPGTWGSTSLFFSCLARESALDIFLKTES